MIGKHQISYTHKNRKPWVCMHNVAIFLSGGNWYYQYKNQASQRELNQSSISAYTLNSLHNDYLLSGYYIEDTLTVLQGSTKVIHLGWL